MAIMLITHDLGVVAEPVSALDLSVQVQMLLPSSLPLRGGPVQDRDRRRCARSRPASW